MPHVDNPQLISASEPEFPTSPTRVERINFVVGFLRRRYLIILICFLLSLPVAGMYLYATPPTYTASATMVIETRKGPVEALVGNAPLEPAWIESQITVLKSQSVPSYLGNSCALLMIASFCGPRAAVRQAIYQFSDGNNCFLS